MAAHVDIGDYEYHGLTLTGTGTARGVDGPPGSIACQFYVETAGVTVYAQTGDQTDGTTDLSTNAGPAPVATWNEVHTTKVSAPQLTADSGDAPNRVTVFFQTDTNPTVIKYRFIPAAERR